MPSLWRRPTARLVATPASSHSASSFFGEVNARYRSCRSVTEPFSGGGTITYSVHSQSEQHVDGHQAVQLVEYVSFSKAGGPPTVTYVLWTIDGTDICVLTTNPLNTKSPQPTQSSLMLKLIARVGALR